MKNLQRIKQSLEIQLRRYPRFEPYHVPPLWISSPRLNKISGAAPNPAELKTIALNPYRFFLDTINFIEKSSAKVPEQHNGREWSREAVIYNMFIRTTCAFDHDQNGKLDVPASALGFREVGTFLKATALLPYVRRLGANTIHLLPITSIGLDGKKGTLGSPYAIRNPYKLDEMLSEPAAGLTPEVEFAAFVEAAHQLGMRVVVEFVFRTASKDSDWILDHPEWFYWIRADVADREPSSTDESKYGTPIFTPDELRHITAAVEQEHFDALLPPHRAYREMFTKPPRPENIKDEQGRLIGYLDDGTRVRIPGAFADWPPDDVQPPWGDVTYLKMHNHPDFNYMAYNTVRMYDARLDRPEHPNHALWEKITGIVPYFQKTFGIDGVMIDMGHSLPAALKQRIIDAARSNDPDFAFWDENFSVTQKSRQEGYNAVIGYCWLDHHDLQKFRNLLWRFEGEGFPMPFFATPESHNTPRAATRRGGVLYSRAAWFADNFMPAIPFIHSGFELGETHPINTGLGFTSEEQKFFPADELPLFSEFAYGWTGKDDISDWIAGISALRREYADLITDDRPSTFKLLETGNTAIVGFMRTNGRRHLLVVANYDFANEQRGMLSFGVPSVALQDLLSGKMLDVKDAKLPLHLAPGECHLLTPESHGE